MSIDLSVRDPESESARRFYVDTAINNFLKQFYKHYFDRKKRVWQCESLQYKGEEFDFGLPFL